MERVAVAEKASEVIKLTSKLLGKLGFCGCLQCNWSLIGPASLMAVEPFWKVAGSLVEPFSRIGEDDGEGCFIRATLCFVLCTNGCGVIW